MDDSADMDFIMNMEPVYKSYCQIVFDDFGAPADIRLKPTENFNFSYDVLDVIAEAEPDRRALMWCSDRGEERSFSFRMLSELSMQTAACLHRMGIGRGDRVFLMMNRHYAYWYILPALHRLGAVGIPATHMLTEADIAHRLRFANVKAIISVGEPEQCGKLRAAAETVGGIPLFCVEENMPGFRRLDLEISQYPASFPRQQTRLHDPMLLYFTSGTTGTPKAVFHDFGYPLCHIPTALCWQGVQDGGLHLSVADTGWAKASWGKIYGQWLCGSAVMVYDCKNLYVPDLLKVLKKYEVTTFCAPPTVYRYLVKFGFDPDAFASVKRVTTAGETLNPSISTAFTQITGLPVYEGYGQTETVLVSACMGAAIAPAGSIGKASPLYEVTLDGLPGEDWGEVVLTPRNPNLPGFCAGYLLEDGGVVSPMDAQGRYHTGDLMRRDENGYFFFCSRKDDVIKSSGFRISPYEVEDVLIQHPAISDCVVRGIPDEERGNVVKACIVLHPGIVRSAALEREIRKFCLQRIAQYKCPRVLEFREELPKTISGKNRRAKAEHGAGDADRGSF